MSFVLVGLNHKSAPLDLLERVCLADAARAKLLVEIAGRAEVSEAVVVSTCQRIEVFAVAERFHPAVGDLREALAAVSGVAVGDFALHVVELHGDDAARHLFRLACGLESSVVGETEILGQVRTAVEVATEAGSAGPELSALFRRAVAVGRRARSTTAIARGVASVSAAAVAMAADRLDGLAGRSVVVLGAGTVGEGMAVALADAADPGAVVVANRSRARATALAQRVGGRAVDFGALATELLNADVLLTSTGATDTVVTRADLEAVQTERAGRALLVVDVAVPRDVDPEAKSVEGVTLLDMDDLRTFAALGEAGRRREVAAVESLIDAALDEHHATMSGRRAAPLITALRARAEEMRLAELERIDARLGGLDAREREAIDALTRSVVAKLLHEPTVRLKQAAGTAKGERLASSLRELFDLDP
ncbi:MAG TPA: glutamyl-tRNA reductase [Acidimicrobiales bacterium]|nr:glutamyl-tRNA reductase [Acidimicrobiales bacterium]